MRVEVFQITTEISDIKTNVERILGRYQSSKADVCVFPELATIGYTPQDLLFDKAFIKQVLDANMHIISQTKEQAIIFGSITQENGKLYNSAIVAQNGQVIGTSSKQNLPNTGVFCESRYFSEGEPSIVNINGTKFGVLVCEDTWHESSYSNMKDAEVLCSINASPYENFPNGKSKLQKRIEIVANQVSKLKKPFVYCNCIGFLNGIVFDGNSFVIEENFKQMKAFEEDSYVFSIPDKINLPSNTSTNLIEEAHKAIIFGLRSYFKQAKQSKVLLGLSGGADSALVATLAAEALGKENVLCVMMPSRYTSKESLDDATLLAKNIGVQLRTVPIQKIIDECRDALDLEGKALENIQSRMRTNILMAISNQENALMLGTGNKSEGAVGYCSLYGDTCGAIDPIKDLYKTQVFAMMRYINKDGEIIPSNIITKPPTAELKDNQKDTDSLPPYEVLDAILMQLIEEGKPAEEVEGFDKHLAQKIAKMLKGAEFKRWQTCPGIKLSSRSFEKSEWKFNIF